MSNMDAVLYFTQVHSFTVSPSGRSLVEECSCCLHRPQGKTNLTGLLSTVNSTFVLYWLQVVEFSLSKLKYTSLTRLVESDWFRPHVPVNNILFDNSNKHCLILYDESVIYVLARSQVGLSLTQLQPIIVEEKYNTKYTTVTI
jgi:hypothetical protein